MIKIQKKNFPFSIQNIQLPDGRNVVAIKNKDGYMVDNDTALSLISQMINFYKEENSDQVIQELNNDLSFDVEMYKLQRNLHFEQKKFKKTKNRSRSWVFYCKWCEKRCVDDLMGDFYYRVNHNIEHHNCCSYECAKELYDAIYKKEKQRLEEKYGYQLVGGDLYR